VTQPFRGSVLEATVDWITFANPETGYPVARVDTGRGGDLVTVVGSLLGAQPGEALRAIYLAPFHRAEISLASQLLTLLHTSADRMAAFRTVDWDKALAWLHRHTRAELAPEQHAAVKLALTEKLAVLTGGPGCGKSFTVRSVVALAAAKRAKIV